MSEEEGISVPYTLIDKIIEKQKADREKRRSEVLSALKGVLKELAPKYSFSRAYIFGSIVKEGKFRRESDIDIAVFNLKDQYFFRLMAEISGRLERDVDLYQIGTMDDGLRRRVEERGVLWKKED